MSYPSLYHSAITRRSPIVLIYTLVMIEFLAFLAYFLATGHGNYKYEIYNQSFFANFISYDTAKLFFLAGAQFVITVYAFMRWYYESYSVETGVLTHQWGVFFKKRKEIPLDKSMTTVVSSGPLGKLLHYGSIRVENGYANKTIVLKDISRPEHFMKNLKYFINPHNESFIREPDVAKMLQQEEHEQLEFKSSLRFDYATYLVNRELEKSVMKTLAAFMNSNGGHLVIGVGDHREILGLACDYHTLPKPSSDGFENHFTQVFNNMIGPEFRSLVKLWFHKVGEHELCTIQVLKGARPAYVKLDQNEHFYIRTGNSTIPLKMSETENYNSSRFSNTHGTEV